MSKLRFAAIAAFVFVTASSAATPPADQLVPENAVYFVTAPDAAKFLDAWPRTQFGRLLDDPALKPFREEFERAGTGLGVVDALGLSLEGVKAAAGGQVALAVVPLKPGKAAVVFLLDTTGKAEGRAALLKRAGEKVAASKGKVGTRAVGGLQATVYEIPEKAGTTEVLQALKDDVLILADDAAVFAGILGRFADGKGGLAGHAAYKNVLDRTTFPDGQATHVTWYLDPFGLDGAVRVIEEKQKKRDTMEIMRLEGFDAVKALGGRVRLEDGPYDLVHRTAVYAPGPFQKAARLLEFPAGAPTAPPAWVPADVARYAVYQWDLDKAFASVGSLIDRFTGEEGDFADVLKGLKEDKDGPMVDVAKDVVGRLTGRVTLISDCPEPLPDRGERGLFAFEVKGPEEKALAASIKALLENEADVVKREVTGVTAWELTPKPKKKKGGGKPVELPTTTIAVAKGNLFVADHSGILEKVLGKSDGTRLAADAGFTAAIADAEKLAGAKPSLRYYSRLAESLRGPYELARTDRLAKSKTLPAQVLRNVLESENGRKVDATKLPPAEKVKHYLQSYAGQIAPAKDGWDVVGFVLKEKK
jgi:hypothetical protein